MKITKEISLKDFEAWSGAKDTLNELTESECEQLESVIEELNPDGIDETSLNDILWFENDWIAECLGYRNWEHLERDHAGETDEDHARTIIYEKFPNATCKLVDDFIDEQWDDDDDDDTILEEFEEYMNDQNKDEDE